MTASRAPHAPAASPVAPSGPARPSGGDGGQAGPGVLTPGGLTAGEQALWLLHQLAPQLGLANVAIWVDPGVPMRWWPIQEAFACLVRRHPALRSRFVTRDGVPVREVCPAEEIGDADVAVEIIDSDEDDLADAARRFAAAPFTLDRAPLIRLGLFRHAPDRFRFCVTAHHLVMDAVSLGVLLEELQQTYLSLARTGEPPALPAVASLAPPPATPGSVQYWRDQLAGFDRAGMRLPSARPYADPPSFAGEEVEVTLPADMTGMVAELRRRSRGTDPAVLLAAYLLALRYEGAADDLLVGLMANTRGSAVTGEIGYRVSTLPLRVRLDPEETFAALVGRVGPALLSAVEHADAPFETVAPELGRAGDDPHWWRGELLRHLFNYRLPFPDSMLKPPGHVGGPADRAVRELHTGLVRFDLELTAELYEGSFILRLVYSEEVHDRAFAERLLERLRAVLEQAYAEPDRAVGDLDLLTAAETAVLADMNDTGREWDGPATVADLIARAAQAAPEAVAFSDGEPAGVTYAELTAAAADIGATLREHGVRPGDVVAVTGPRGPELAAAVLGVWAAGGCYLPLDPEHPAERLRYQLDDAGCATVLDGHRLPEACIAGRTAVPVPAVRRPEHSAPAAPGDRAPLTADPAATAYLIYTSGSTGRPKGVRLTHANLANVVRHFAEHLGADGSVAMSWLTTFAFDISALELFLPLVVGGRVVVVPDAVRTSPTQLLDLLDRHGVTIVQATPTTWRLLLNDAGDRLAGRTALCGGEPMTPRLARALKASGSRALNVYGPTETTIWSTAVALATEDPRALTVGRPIANTRAYVLDDRGRPRAIGVPGELCLTGSGVAEGYHAAPELTAERFPTAPALGRYYRTGDLARVLPDGRIELLGRRDRQLKLRGHRIEPAEVERRLEEHPAVRAAAVVLRGDPAGDGQLAAYVVADDRPGLTGELWEHCRAALPDYSVPGRFAVLAALPQTPNGKVDLTALASLDTAPAAAGSNGPPAPAEPNAGADANAGATPGSAVEALIDAVWRGALGDPPAGRDANFFLSGGSSLQAAQLATGLSEVCAVPVTLAMVFQAPTPARLADLIRAHLNKP